MALTFLFVQSGLHQHSRLHDDSSVLGFRGRHAPWFGQRHSGGKAVGAGATRLSQNVSKTGSNLAKSG